METVEGLLGTLRVPDPELHVVRLDAGVGPPDGRRPPEPGGGRPRAARAARHPARHPAPHRARPRGRPPHLPPRHPAGAWCGGQHHGARRRVRCGPDASGAPVTPREYDVLRLIASGHTTGEIGERLRLSPNTVTTYPHNVMRELDARNRAQVITNARAHGLL